MFGFTQRFGRHSQARHARVRHLRLFNASLEVVEDRTLMSTLSAISWDNGNGPGVEVFGIGSNGSVYANKDDSGFVSLGGYAKQISAGLDAAGNPEVYVIGGDNALYVNDNGKGFVDLGGYVTAISATADNAVFAIGGGNAVFVNRGSGFTSLGGFAQEISAGLDGGNGFPEVYAIGGDNAAYSNDNGSGWADLGGYVTELSDDGGDGFAGVYARGRDVGSIYDNQGLGWNDLGSIGTQNANATTSPNWSGYVAETSFSQPQQNSVSAVSGSWVVPKVTGPSKGATYGSVWVGIDGYSNSTVEQVGTEEDWVNGSPVYDAWWEMYSSGDQQPEQVITGMTVKPGDSISASVQYITSGAHAGQFDLSIVDNSRANDSFSTYETSSQTQNPLAQRSSAEWIVEAPSVGGRYATLANFGSVFFSNATAVIDGVSGPINSPSWQSQAVNIASGGVTYDTTSILINSGDSFVVTYNTSAGDAAPAMAAPNFEAREQSGTTTGVARQLAKKVSDPVVSYNPATGYTRPAQESTTGTDPSDDSYADFGNNTTASDINDLAEQMVLSATSPTLTRTRSYNRKL
jgi:Peptidase A4 family